MNPIITIAAALLLTGCNSVHTARQLSNDTLPTLPVKLEVGRYSLDPDTATAAPLAELTADQRLDLARQTRLEVPDSAWLIGARAVDGKRLLTAYKVSTSEDVNDFTVYFVTSASDGSVIDAIDLGRFHSSEPQLPLRFGGNRFYTRDASVTFDGDRRFTQHVTMTLTSIYLKDRTLTQAWRVDWDNHYEIDNQGRFIFLGQQETLREKAPDDPKIEEFKSRDRNLASRSSLPETSETSEGEKNDNSLKTR